MPVPCNNWFHHCRPLTCPIPAPGQTTHLKPGSLIQKATSHITQAASRHQPLELLPKYSLGKKSDPTPQHIYSPLIPSSVPSDRATHLYSNPRLYMPPHFHLLNLKLSPNASEAQKAHADHPPPPHSPPPPLTQPFPCDVGASLKTGCQ